MSTEIYEMTKNDFIMDIYMKQIAEIMLESEQLNYPSDIIPRDFGLLEYEKLKKYYYEGKAKVALLLEGGKIISYVWYFFREKRIHINEIATHKDYRGFGFGTMLLEYVFSKGSENDVNAIELFVLENNENAMRFYSKRGFVTEKRLLRRDQ